MRSWDGGEPLLPSIQDRCNSLLLSVLGHMEEGGALAKGRQYPDKTEERETFRFLETEAKVLPDNSGVRTIIKELLI